jgi:hypothetical protein
MLAQFDEEASFGALQFFFADALRVLIHNVGGQFDGFLDTFEGRS